MGIKKILNSILDTEIPLKFLDGFVAKKKSEKSDNPVGIKLTGERLRQEEKKMSEIADGTIADIVASDFFKKECLSDLFEKIRANTKVGYGYIDPFDKGDCLTLEEKKSLKLNTKRKYSRELINCLTEKGLAAENPNDLLRNIFLQNYHKIFRKYELARLKELGLRYVEISDCGDERDCSAVKRIKKRWLIDEVPELPLPNCKADYCRCCYIADEKELLGNWNRIDVHTQSKGVYMSIKGVER